MKDFFYYYWNTTPVFQEQQTQPSKKGEKVHNNGQGGAYCDLALNGAVAFIIYSAPAPSVASLLARGAR